MRGERSAYDVLGLEPGAEREEVERSYRRLIKIYHPDRPDGDRAKAEQVIEAYRSIISRPLGVDDMVFNEPPAKTTSSASWQIAGLLLAIGLLLLAPLGGPFDSEFGSRLRAVDLSGRTGDAASSANGTLRAGMPIDDRLIGRVAAEAWHDFSTRTEDELADISRSCHREFLRATDVRRFDRCVAYDRAIIVLQDRDPVGDKGPFQESAVVRRHWADAAQLTRDVYAIDTRLDRIRLEVELALASASPSARSSREDQRVVELPSAASVGEASSEDNDQRSVSDAANLSE